MKNLLPLAALLFAASSAHADAQAGKALSMAQSNVQATRQYYQQVSGAQGGQLSEIRLLMTMMPKGGDIHHHYSGAHYAETYLDWGERQGYCIYREADAARHKEKYTVETKPPAAGCISVDAVRKDTAFYRELIAQWSDMDFHNHGQLQAPPDQHFFNTFAYFGAVSSYNNNLGLQLLKRRAKAENLQYIETMIKSAPTLAQAIPPESATRLDALPPDADDAALAPVLAAYADLLQADAATQQAITDYVQGLQRDVAGIADADFTLRVQSYVSRNNAPSKVFAGMYAAFAASARSPLIVGVNIVGPEHGVVALRDYQLHMRMFRFLKQRYPQVHLALHAGELAPGLVPPEDLRGHITDAINIASAERIGHGVDVVHESNADQLLAALKKRKIAVEINLTSNDFILGVSGAAHPVTTYLRHGVPIVLSTDDAGVSRNELSGEYALFVSRYHPTYDALKQVVYNGIRYSFLSDSDKAAELKKLDQRFVRFEAAVAALARSAR